MATGHSQWECECMWMLLGMWRTHSQTCVPYLPVCVKVRNETEKREILSFGHIYSSAHPIPHCNTHTHWTDTQFARWQTPNCENPLIPYNQLSFLFPKETHKLFSPNYEIFVFLFLRWARGLLCFHVGICRAPAHNGPSVRLLCWEE